MTQAVFDHALELRDIASGAVTQTTSTTPITVPVRTYPPCSWVIYTTAVASGGGDEGYVFTLQVSDTSSGTFTTIATHDWPAAHGTGKIHVPVSGDLAKFQDADSDWVRVTMTASGASPSITYGSYLTKSTTGLGVAARPQDVLSFAT
jgi:hypothetical protein